MPENNKTINAKRVVMTPRAEIEEILVRAAA